MSTADQAHAGAGRSSWRTVRRRRGGEWTPAARTVLWGWAGHRRVPGKHSESARILLGPAVQLISRCGLGNLVVESDKDSLSQTLPTVARLTDTGSDGNDRLGKVASGFGVELTGAIFLTPTKARHGPPSFLSSG